MTKVRGPKPLWAMPPWAGGPGCCGKADCASQKQHLFLRGFCFRVPALAVTDDKNKKKMDNAKRRTDSLKTVGTTAMNETRKTDKIVLETLILRKVDQKENEELLRTNQRKQVQKWLRYICM